jgi:hypothetical protein
VVVVEAARDLGLEVENAGEYGLEYLIDQQFVGREVAPASGSKHPSLPKTMQSTSNRNVCRIYDTAIIQHLRPLHILA